MSLSPARNVLASAIAVALALVGCGETVVEVTVDSRETVSGVQELVVTLENDGDVVERRFDTTGRDFPLTFTITPGGRGGELTLTFRGANADGLVVGAAAATADLGSGARLDVRLDPADFLVNSDTEGVQRPAFRLGRNGRALASTAEGFVATFVNDCSVAANCDVFVRRFDGDGTPLVTRSSDAEFSINNIDHEVVSVPAVASNAAGDIAVVWETSAALFASQIAADGTQIANDVRITELTVEDPVDPAIIAVDNDFVITWVQESDNPNPAGLQQRVFAGGIAQPATLARDSSDAATPALATGAGINLLTAWAEEDSVFVELTPAGGAAAENVVVAFSGETVGALQAVQTASGFALSYGRSSLGEPRGLTLTELDVGGGFVRDLSLEATPRSAVDRPALCATPEGGIAVAWTDCGAGGDGDGCGVVMQVFNADLSPASAVIGVNTTTRGDQFDPAIAPVGDGYAVMWSDSSGVAPDTSGGTRARVIYSDTL